MTGGANGLGRAICSELARCGCNVAVADVDIENAREFAEELTFLGVKAKAYEAKIKNIIFQTEIFGLIICDNSGFQVDVANYDEIVALKEKVNADFGAVDILVNNAGLLPKVSLLQGEPNDLQRIVNVNLLGHFWVRTI